MFLSFTQGYLYNNRTYLYIMGSISHPVLFIFVYIVAYKYLRSTKKSILYQQLFCRCIKSYLIAVFRLISYIVFTEALIFISFTFYLPTKNVFVIKNIKSHSPYWYVLELFFRRNVIAHVLFISIVYGRAFYLLQCTT